MKTKKDLFNYIKISTNWNINEKVLNVNLPIYIKSAYELWNTQIAGVDVLFLKIKDSNIDMRIHQNAVKKIEEPCSCNTVLVFEKLDNRNSNSLIKKHISFIVQNKQIYIPFALTQIKTEDKKINLKRFNQLSVDADMILVSYLDNRITNKIMIKDIASVINKDSRMVSKALDVLLSMKLISIEKVGRSKHIYFESKKEIYYYLKKHIQVPIKYSFYVNEYSSNNIVYSGYTALSIYSSFIDATIKTIAIDNKEVKSLNIKEIECEKESAKYKIEVWDRNPSLFSKDKAINPLYLLRLFTNIDDERTEYALDEIEEEIINKFEDNK
ncbi:hypothetical protein KO488_05810 [Poseidonibacter lekithochrous]|uniref:hypothetical protein n=1 Tax=Poseidonibacter TaxID=2321187 RepID=UPI001C09EE75|nr:MULTISPECIES: hypothetical protein [Poseidonibacter]MBU3014266.1 hypothetical protein [Poseidonibacter lekithochrous]MDO6827563.1 hypothetical protein [Poseidonibacter sp. 1_MG-2023]